MFAYENPLEVRFIEFMPLGDWQDKEYTLVSGDDILKMIRSRCDIEEVF